MEQRRLQVSIYVQAHGTPTEGYFDHLLAGTSVPEGSAFAGLRIDRDMLDTFAGFDNQIIEVPELGAAPTAAQTAAFLDAARAAIGSTVEATLGDDGPNINYRYRLFGDGIGTINEPDKPPRWHTGTDGLAFEVGIQDISSTDPATIAPHRVQLLGVQIRYWVLFELSTNL